MAIDQQNSLSQSSYSDETKNSSTAKTIKEQQEEELKE